MVDANAIKGYVCPSCRLLVSASAEMLGMDVLCPGCRSLIRLPKLNESMVFVDPGVLTTASYAHVDHNVSAENWRDDMPIGVLSARAKGLPWAMLLPSLALGFGLLLCLIGVLFFTQSKPVELTQSKVATEPAQGEKATQSPVVGPSVAEVKALLTQLHQAENLDELAPLLRDVPELDSKLAHYYTGREIAFSRPLEIVIGNEVLNNRGLYLFDSSFARGVKKSGVVTQISNGSWALDWESYVGYCDIEWDDLPELQPKQPSLVRAIRLRTEYYNQGFTSDEWQSFKLSSPESAASLIGYVRRNSALIHQLLPIGNQSGAMDVTLKIHYPENVSDPRLVIIDEVIGSDWITPNQK